MTVVLKSQMIELQGILRTGTTNPEWVPSTLEPNYLREALSVLLAIGYKNDITIWDAVVKSIVDPAQLLVEHPKNQGILLALNAQLDKILEQKPRTGILTDIIGQWTKALGHRDTLIPTYMTPEGVATPEGKKVLARKTIQGDEFQKQTNKNGDWRHLEDDTEVNNHFLFGSENLTHLSPHLIFLGELLLASAPKLTAIVGHFEEGLRVDQNPAKTINITTGETRMASFVNMPELTQISGTYQIPLVAINCPKLTVLNAKCLGTLTEPRIISGKRIGHYIIQPGKAGCFQNCPSLPAKKKFSKDPFQIDSEIRTRCLREAGQLALAKNIGESFML